MDEADIKLLKRQRKRMLERRIVSVDVNTSKTVFLKHELTDRDVLNLNKKGWSLFECKLNHTWYFWKEWNDYIDCKHDWKICINSTTKKVFRFAYKAKPKIVSKPFWKGSQDLQSFEIENYFPCIYDLIELGLVKGELEEQKEMPNEN